MRVVVGTIDGQTHESVVVTDETMQAELDKLDGRIGTGYMEEVICRTPAEFKEFLRNFFKDSSLTHVSLNTAEGEKVFRAEHIVWTRVED
jgi:hypothetical protein